MSAKCPFDEQDCLRARELLSRAVTSLAALVPHVHPQDQEAALRARGFLKLPEVEALIDFQAHIDEVVRPIPKSRAEAVRESMKAYQVGTSANLIAWFLENLYLATDHSLRRAVALCLMVGASAARSSKGAIRVEDWLDLARWAFEHSEEDYSPRHLTKPGSHSIE